MSPALLIHSSPGESQLGFSVEVWVCMNQPGRTLSHCRKQQFDGQRGLSAAASVHMRQEGTGRTGKGFERALKGEQPQRDTAHIQQRPHDTASNHDLKTPAQATPDPGNPSGENHEANLAEAPQTAITLKTAFLPCWFIPTDSSPGEGRRWHSPEALMLVQNDSLLKEPPCLQDTIWEQCRSPSKSQWGLSHAGEPQAVHRDFPGSEGTSH